MKREDLLDLNDALQHPGRQIAVDIVSELPEEEDLELVEPITGFLEAVSTGNLLLLKGSFEAKLVLPCARCLAPLPTKFAFQLDEQFPVQGVPSSLSSQDYARVVDEEVYPLFDGNSLMVENLLRQALIVEIPNQPLCEAGWDAPCMIAESRGVKRAVESGNSLRMAPLANLRISDGADGE